MRCKMMALLLGFCVHSMMMGEGTVKIYNELNGAGIRWDLRTTIISGVDENKSDRWVSPGPGTSDSYSISSDLIFLSQATIYWMSGDNKTKAYFSTIDLNAAKLGTWVFICKNNGIRSLHASGAVLNNVKLSWTKSE